LKKGLVFLANCNNFKFTKLGLRYTTPVRTKNLPLATFINVLTLKRARLPFRHTRINIVCTSFTPFYNGACCTLFANLNLLF